MKRPGSLFSRACIIAGMAFALPAVAAVTTTPADLVCRKLEGREPPAADRPTPAQIKTLKGCDSEALYYGEKGEPDFIKARLCAFWEDREGEGSSRTANVFSGPTILMQIYANGLGGVKRDLDQATAYACDVDGAPAEIEYRVRRLQALKTKVAIKRFDYCDDVTSGLAGGFCAARDAEIAKKGRAARVANIEAHIPASARPALAMLRKAAAAFVDARGGEVDETGTARAQMVIDEEEATRETFTTHLAQLIDGKWPRVSTVNATAADVALNSAYKKALAFLGSDQNLTTVKPEDVRKTQRAWIAYREAFVSFARIARPEVMPTELMALLSQERASSLGGLAN